MMLAAGGCVSNCLGATTASAELYSSAAPELSRQCSLDYRSGDLTTSEIRIKPRDSPAFACDNDKHRQRNDMEKRTLEHFRRVLMARRDELRDRLSAAKQHSRQIADDAKDEGDRANASVTADMTAAQQVQTERLLGGICAALLRIEHGTFGDCAQCGQEIGAKRLEAVPWTRFCITCQD
jgi:DnaK suppressor protein